MKYSAEKREKLKGYYDSLLGQREIFADPNDAVVSELAFNGLAAEIGRVKQDFPELVPYRHSMLTRSGVQRSGDFTSAYRC